MKYPSRTLSLLVAGALLVSMAGCSSNTASSSASSAAASVLSAEESTLSLAGATAFTFTDSGISAAEGDYSGYAIEGTALTITPRAPMCCPAAARMAVSPSKPKLKG